MGCPDSETPMQALPDKQVQESTIPILCKPPYKLQ